MATPNHVPPPLPDIYLDPSTGFLALPEDHDNLISDVRESLDALAWLGDELASVNMRRRADGDCTVTLQVPPEGFAALMRILAERLERASGSPPIRQVLAARPDLCKPRRAS